MIGHGDQYYAEMLEPPLTAVHLPLEEVGKRAAYLVLSKIEGADDTATEKIILQNDLVVRKSTAVYTQLDYDSGKPTEK